MLAAGGPVNFVWEVSFGHVAVACLVFAGFCFMASKLVRTMIIVKVNSASLVAIAKQMEDDRAMWSRFCFGVAKALNVDWKPDDRMSGHDAGGIPR